MVQYNSQKRSAAFVKLCVIFGTAVLRKIGPVSKVSKDYQTSVKLRTWTLLGRIWSKSSHE